MVSRTPSKLEAVEKRIKKENKDVQTCLIQFDFAGATSMDEYEKLRSQVVAMGMDVSLLVVNAGMILFGQLTNQSLKEVQSMMDINMYHPTAMLKKFLPELSERKGQSGIVIVSSTAANVAAPALAVYAASKAYLSTLCLAIDGELASSDRTRIDM